MTLIRKAKANSKAFGPRIHAKKRELSTGNRGQVTAEQTKPTATAKATAKAKPIPTADPR